MRHISLKSQGLWPVHAFEEIHHFLPTMHAAPANFSFGRKPFAVGLRNVARLAESLDDFPLVHLRVLCPILDAGSRVYSYDPVRARAKVPEFARHPARVFHLF